MFQVYDRVTREAVTVYAVHKSGPMDEQTKFLVHEGGAWRWAWASRFDPVAVEPVARRSPGTARARRAQPASVAVA
jgi:hypothetical protein